MNNNQTSTLTLEYHDQLAVITWGDETNPTFFDSDFLTQLERILNELAVKIERGEEKTLLFLSKHPTSFLHGVSSSLLRQLTTEAQAIALAERTQNLFNRIEDFGAMGVSTVAMVDGVCEGPGVELILACKYRLSTKNSSFFFPYVHWGLGPLGGASYRLPQILSLKEVLRLLVRGERIGGEEALQWKLVTALFNRGISRSGVEGLIQSLTEGVQGSFDDSGKMGKATLEFLTRESFLGRKFIFHKAREQWLQQTRGLYQAPLKLLELLDGGQGKGRSGQLHQEALAFGNLAISDQSHNLRHLYYQVNTLKEKYSPLPSPTSTSSGFSGNGGSRVGVIGVGALGAGVAQVALENGYTVPIKDRGRRELEMGLRVISKAFEEENRYGRGLALGLGHNYSHNHGKDFGEDWKRRLMPSIKYSGFKQCRFVVESIDEDLAQKRLLLSEVEQEIDPNAILISTTSSLSIGELAKNLKYPKRFAGMQFFNPVDRVQLVELVVHDQVSNETVEQLYRFALSLGKVPIVVKDAPGFLIGRLLMPFFNDAINLLEEGVSVLEIDQAARHFGFVVGPLRLMDEIGMDLILKVAKIFYEAFGGRAMLGVLSDSLVQYQILGKKNHQGFYIYHEDGHVLRPNPLFKEIFLNKSKDRNRMGREDYDEVLIQKRLVMPMINEAFHILEDGVVSEGKIIDVASVLGFGFPAFRGGLLKYAEEVGLKRVLADLKHFETTINQERFRPAKLLIRLVEEQRTLYQESQNRQ